MRSRIFPMEGMKWIYALLAAFQFLSRIPIPVNVPFEPAVLRRSLIFFPLVGGGIGLLLLGGGRLMASTAVPPLAASVLLTAFWVYVTGGLHLDGLMDTADGLFSQRSRERMLEIMKDSRVGAMGVIAGVLQLLLKASLLEAWMASPHWDWKQAVWIAAAPIWSRWFMTAAIVLWPFARRGEGLASLFSGAGLGHLIPSAILAMAAAAGIFSWAGMPFSSACTASLLTGIGSFAVGGALCVWMTRKLGGLTGDTYGAANEFLETAVLLGAVIWMGGNV